MKEDIVSSVMSCIMFATSASIFYSSLRFAPNHRFYHYMCFTISSFASVAYSAMICFDNDMIRYIEWALTTPVELVILGSMSDIDPINIYMMCLFDILMITTGALGNYAGSIIMTCVYMIMSTICIMPILYFLFIEMDYSAMPNIQHQKRALWVTRFLMTTWIMYPIVWAIQVFGLTYNRIVIMIMYSFLDMLSKFIFVIMILLLIDDCNQPSISSVHPEVAIAGPAAVENSSLRSPPSS